MTIKKKTIILFEKLKMRYDAFHQYFLKPVWQERLLKNRLRSLIVMAGIGSFISLCFYKRVILGLLMDSWLFQNLTLLFLSLPVLVLLWFYRTHDVQEQIDKAQSNINSSKLNKGIDLLLTEDTREDNHGNKRSAGLIMLAKLLQQDKTLRTEINVLIRGVKLQGADLYGAQLQGITLRDADLSSADLRAANLENVNLESANLQDAKYDEYTKFPDGFNPKRAGMKLS